MNKFHDILEVCIQDIENGADVETVLFRYAEFAEELRPILETVVKARNAAVSGPGSDVVRRSRAKVLQHAAELREAKGRPSRSFWSVSLRRALVSLAVIAALFISSTSLVQAASATIPGDNLYPVKRTWEDVRVLFTFDKAARTALEVEYENERLKELSELFAQGRSAPVDFAGVVTRQNGDLWRVAGIPVVLPPQADVRDPIAVGDAVRVRGVAQVDGSVLAERVDLLDAGVALPDVDDDIEIEQDHSGNGNDNNNNNDNDNNNSGPGSGNDSEPEELSFEGTVDSINGYILTVDGLSMDISDADVRGNPEAGRRVKVEGYYGANGVFIVTRIEFLDNDSGGDSSGSEDSDNNSNDDAGNDNSDDNSNDGNDNDNSGGGDNDNDNDNDNSGSGGGNDNDNDDDND